jgi:hypothetical protein
MPRIIAGSATRSTVSQGPGSPAHRVRKLKEKPTTTLIAVSDPFRKVASMVSPPARGVLGRRSCSSSAIFVVSIRVCLQNPGATSCETDAVKFGQPIRWPRFTPGSDQLCSAKPNLDRKMVRAYFIIVYEDCWSRSRARRAIEAGAWSGMAKTELTLISHRT